MGCFKKYISSTNSHMFTSSKVNINPNPSKFKIKEMIQSGIYLIVEINYPNCTNYEGNKILVFKNIGIETLCDMREIDPHFTNSSNLIARFVPTNEGWDAAMKMVRALAE